MNMKDLYPSRFLKAEDFEEGEVKTRTIKQVEIEELGQGKEAKSKPVVFFRDDEKQLVLNKTNAVIIAKLYGDETDDWLGKRITMYAVEVESFGDVVRAIRVRTTAPKAATAPKAQPAPEPEPELFEEEMPADVPGYVAPAPKIHVPSKETAEPANGNGNGSKKRAVIQTPRIKELLEWAVENGYAKDVSTSSGYHLMQVIGNAGIPSFNELNFEECKLVIQAHYEAKAA